MATRSLPERMAALPVTRFKDAIFVPLPVELWRPADGCSCDVCKADGSRGYWDTLAVAKDAPSKGHNDYTYTVHYPSLHPVDVRRAKALADAQPQRYSRSSAAAVLEAAANHLDRSQPYELADAAAIDILDAARQRVNPDPNVYDTGTE